MSVAASRTAPARRDLPIPGSPTSSTSRRSPARAASSAACRIANSSSRPTRGVAAGRSLARAPVASPTASARTRADLPLALNGSTGVRSKSSRTRRRTAGVASTAPGSAFAITRAARFTASPISDQTRRAGSPMSALNTGPRLTPARTSSGQSRPTTSLSAWSIRSSSSGEATGAPALRISLPPSRSTSEET